MHEMGIAIQIMDAATASLPDDIKTLSIKKINLKVGKLAAVIPSRLRSCFEIVAKGTPFEGSILEIKKIPAIARCRNCAAQWTINAPDTNCKNCKNGSIDIISGQELIVDSLEINDMNEQTH